ncbi:MAG: ABC transporter ATP-binding protein, partial [Clostridiales bacterium]
IGIARALAVNPQLIMCDEPISALDVSIQAQIINMLEHLQEERNLSYLFIAHDLSMVRHISHRIGVMYLGNLVEIGKCSTVYHHPLHPYTKALLSAVPIPDPDQAKKQQRQLLTGEIPSPLTPPVGCPFVTRCASLLSCCSEIKPQMKEVDGRQVACHLYD